MGSRLGFARDLTRLQMKPTWKHDEIFPIIAHGIEREYRAIGRYNLDEPEPTKPVVTELIVGGCHGLACGSVNAGER